MLYKTALGVAISAALSLSVSANQDIEKITITANKFEQPLSDVLASVEVIERADIEASNVRDLPTLLGTQAGIQVNPNGGFGQNSGVSLRGTGSGDTLILIDGVRTGSATLGQKALSNVPLNSIERIEIVKGSRAAVYGSDALAGVINIITRQANNISLDATFGSNNYQNYQLAGAVQKAGLKTAFNAGFEKTDGFDVLQGAGPDDDGYENKNLGFNVNYSDSQLGDVKLLGQYSEGFANYDSGFSPFDSTVENNEFKNYQIALGWSKTYENQSHRIDISFATDDSDNTYTDYFSGDALTSTFITKRSQIDYSGQYTFNSEFNISGGVNWYNDDVSQSSIVFDEQSRDVLAVFVGAYFDNDQVLANLTLRNDDDEKFGNETTYTAAAGYHLSEYAVFRVSQSTGFKAPTFNDLYYPNFGNADLQPETSLNTEIGLTVNYHSTSVDVAIFRNDIEDKIDYDANFALANIDEARYEGVEFSLSNQVFGIDSDLNVTYLTAENTVTGEQLNYVSKQTLNWALAKELGDFDASISMQYRGDREGSVSRLGSYTLFNVAGNYQLNDHIAFSLRVENLFDREYNVVDSSSDFVTGDVYYYNTPERRFFVGASYQF
ncbi:TonB-dependent receptor [Pseudoalteromonas sp. MMG010]|uniref:TonB-dependent receptor domain-containing protein n=1 Tax=Pseudoalteromonas sp. MMG010 TaxID=2822685 RepID=UPI001B3A64E8|nr:TonB-dependent receptor [Pseudoalteromonas sp. MMG010]MBQ4833969.1 TonB-dependent receptor [Pseudoalteromonas sp. MMG010]